MKPKIIILVLLTLLLSACGAIQQEQSERKQEVNVSNTANRENSAVSTKGDLPQSLLEIPSKYHGAAEKQGTVVNLTYSTYESMTYEQQTTVLTKRAVVYLPYGYSKEKKYNVFYLMHGGWSDETTYLGTPEKPSEFKNILDNAMANRDIEPIIIVCPTYNNTSDTDSSDYSLAIQLTDNYHNELINDLLPAVEGTYSTYAENVTADGLQASRDHRAFGGFSMGSVATWRTFQYCLDYFRYFMPSSGNLTSSGELMVSMVKDSGHNWNDFFIFAASGTDDFAYSAFRQQIEVMANVTDGTFRIADNEADGNLYFLEKEGGTHSGEYAMQYFYNGLCWLWKSTETVADENTIPEAAFTIDSTVGDVIGDSAFGDFGRLLFPVDRAVSEDMTLAEISTSNVYVWYSNIQPEKTVEILNSLRQQANEGKQIFYSIYSDAEIAEDPTKADTGLFFFHGEPGKEFAVMNAGGGFAYVGAIHDSFPHALEVSKVGYNAFALIYRPDFPYEDLAQALCFIHDNAQELQVSQQNYSLWGGSAGARMAAVLGNADYLQQLTGRADIPQAAAVIMQYTGYNTVSASDAPTYACVGTNDGIASWRTMQARLERLSRMGIPTEFHSYAGLSHGFGIGTGTVADGWIKDAIVFWQTQIK